MLQAVDLFAGCGGLSLGFQNAGIPIKAAFEYWDIAANCYEQNFNHPVFRIDLSDTQTAVKIISAFKPNLIIGGPPCQDFSHAGKRIESNRASLTESFAEIITMVKPAYFIMENVDRAQKSKTYSHARKMFKDSNYGLTELILDASLCGVPQKRKRFFCIGILNEQDNLLEQIVLNNLSDKPATLRDYFGSSLPFQFYYRHPRNYNRRGIFSIDEPAPTMRGVNRPLPKGYPGHPNDACQLNSAIRALSTEERALIQTFPPSFKWIGTKTDMEQMIGNAVPVKLAEFVARSLIQYHQSLNSKKNEEFQTWLVVSQKYSQRTAKDVTSRCKRAEKILTSNGFPDDFYIFTLECQPQFQSLTTPVKSQIKRALKLKQLFLSQKH